MSGLVGDYGSDSGSDDETANAGRSPFFSSEWTACTDPSTGYPYYWNTKTNEVRWENPKEVESSPFVSSKSSIEARKSAALSYPVQNQKRNMRKVAAPSSSPRPSQPFIGPSLPVLKPEDVALQKVRQFEENLAKGVSEDIEKECPPDWKHGRPRPLYTKPFSWKKGEAVSTSVEKLEKLFKTASNPIALIAGYGDDSDDQKSSEEGEKGEINGKTGRKRKIQVRVKSSFKTTKISHLRPVHSIFQSEEYLSDENECGTQEQSKKGLDKKKGFDTTAGPSYKKSIDKVAEVLCEKLEALNVHKLKISPLKLLAVQIETTFEAWQSGALSVGYMQKFLSSTSLRMTQIETDHLAPPGWRAVWNRSVRKYEYENLVTGESQVDPPSHSDDEPEEVAPRSESEKPPLPKEVDRISPPPPPLPPQQQQQEKPPPPPPEETDDVDQSVSNPATTQVQDMDIEEEEEECVIVESMPAANGVNVISSGDGLKDALSSFYSDLAEMDSNSQGSVEGFDTHRGQSPSPAPLLKVGSEHVALVDDGSNSPKAGEVEDTRRKRKGKRIAGGLLLKKRGVGDLVAKWQNIQQESNGRQTK